MGTTQYPPTRHLNARPDYEFPHTEHVSALEDVQERIQAKQAELDELERERLHAISAAIEDGMQQVRIRMHLDVSQQLFRSWVSEAKQLRRRSGERELF